MPRPETAEAAAPQCGTCPYFRAAPDGSMIGQCRRYPPQAVSARERNYLYLFPGMAAQEYCHEHPELAKARDEALAHAIAERIADAISVEPEIVNFADQNHLASSPLSGQVEKADDGPAEPEAKAETEAEAVTGTTTARSGARAKGK